MLRHVRGELKLRVDTARRNGSSLSVAIYVVEGHSGALWPGSFNDVVVGGDEGQLRTKIELGGWLIVPTPNTAMIRKRIQAWNSG